MSKLAQGVQWGIIVVMASLLGGPSLRADTSEPAASEALELPPAEAEEVPAADETPQPPPAPEAATPTLPAPRAATGGGEGLVSVDFKDADIRQVLRILSLKSGVDIVAGNDVEGLVTIKLTNIPWEQALDIILRTYGFTYERKGNIVRVLTLESLEQEALATEVFPLSYAKASQVPDVVNEMLSDRGRIKFDDRTNTVIVTDIPSTLFQIKQVIERLDQRTPQVLIASKVIETRIDNSEDFGIDWSDSVSLTQEGVGLPSTFPFPVANSLGKLGETFIPRAGTFSPSTGAPSTLAARVPDVGGTFTYGTLRFGTLGSAAFQMTMNFVKARTDSKIISNPSISVLDNQEAKVHIGQEYPIPNYTVDPTTGRTTITGYTAKNVGTVLTVTPHVNQSNEIVASIKPEVIAALTEVTYTTGGSNSVTLPRFSVQTAQTQVRLKTGQTVAIGGLTKSADSEKVTKVPFLADLPLVGALFTFTERDQGTGSSDPKRNDLLIFLTMTLINEDSDEQAAVASIPITAERE